MIPITRITPANIHQLQPNEVFVFGSNLAGRHGKGAASDAERRFGARRGQGKGMMGQSYAIATKGWNLEPLALSVIQSQVILFIRYAKKHPERRFLVTAIGTGLAGFHFRQIAVMFNVKGYPLSANVTLPESFWKIIRP